MKNIELVLSNGHFDIVQGAVFAAYGGGMPLLCYEENDTARVMTDPDDGGLYEGRIIIPQNAAPESITIKLRRCSVSVCPMNTGVFSADIKESRAVFAGVRARRIMLSSGRSDINITAAPLVAAELDCGRGSVRMTLERSARGYRFTTLRGAGMITINSSETKRRSTSGTPGGVPVSIKCGLGSVGVYSK